MRFYCHDAFIDHRPPNTFSQAPCVKVCADFCSLYQSPRSDAQSTLFKEGLKSINVLYAHQFTHVRMRLMLLAAACISLSL